MAVQAAVTTGPRTIEVREFPEPDDLAPGAVLLRMTASGICGTDKHTFRGETTQYPGTDKERSTAFPLIQGHENLGVVVAVGPGGARAHDGSPLRPGDRVVPAPNRPCGQCRSCHRDDPYFLCEDLFGYGNSLSSDVAPHLFGGWAQMLYLHPGTPVFRVPEGLPDEVAVLTEIFAVTHSLERAAAVRRPNGFRPGDTVAVVGVGSLGLAHVIKAALMGAGQVVAVDRSAKRLALAERLVGARTVHADADVRGEVRDLTDGVGADVVVDATGFPGSFASTLAIVRDAGTILEVGAFVDMGPEEFDPAVVCGRNLTIMGTAGEDVQAYAGTLALMARHHTAVPLAEMVSHVFPVAEAARAVEAGLDADGAAKVLVSAVLPPRR